MIIIALYPLKVGCSALLSARLDGSFISILKRCLFSSGPVVALVMVLLANLVISIEGMQSGGERGREGEREGGRREEQESGPGVWSHSVCPFSRGYQGDPWQQTTTPTNE